MDPPARPGLRLALAWWAGLTGIILFVPSYPAGFLDGIPADHLLDFLAAIAAAMIMVPRHFGRTSRQQRALLLTLLIVCHPPNFEQIGVRRAWSSGAVRDRNQPGAFQLQRSTFCDLAETSRLDSCVEFDGIRIGVGRHPLWTDFLNSLSLSLGQGPRSACDSVEGAVGRLCPSLPRLHAGT